MELHPPMKIELILAGNFCEMRSNHFHTGLDIKTKGVEGQKLYAIEDGYISRLRVSSWGYGNAIYIQHHNGLTSVYAHCKKFPKFIDSLIYQIQKNYESDVIDQDVLELKIPIKKGELIGYSGNSGSSSAPHLHFEIRETATEHAINPLLFKCYQKLIKDTTIPTVKGVKFYAINPKGFLVPGKEKYFYVKNVKNQWFVNNGKPINIDDLLVDGCYLSIGLHALDRLDGAYNWCGIYNVKVFKDNQLIHEQKMEYMDFEVNRFINTHQDYYAFKQQNRHIHKQFSTVINPLPIYPLKNGKIEPQKRNGTYKISVYDVHQNKVDIVFKVNSNEDVYSKNPFKYSKKYFFPDTVNFILEDSFQALFETGTFYEPLEIHYKVTQPDSSSQFIGDFYAFTDGGLPVQKKFDLRLKLPVNYEHLPKSKLAVVYLDYKNRVNYIGGHYVDGWIESSVRAFGKYTIMIDTLAPLITPLDFKENQNISKYNTLELNIVDDLSGLKTYRAFINNNWVLMVYNKKKRKFIIPLDYRSKIHLKKGSNKVKIIAVDAKNNTSEIETTLIY